MNIILALGIMLIAGFFGGMLAHRLKFPRITGYIIVGLILSPSVLNIIPKVAIDDLDILTSIALGIIAYSIGGSLDLGSIRKLGRSIAWITLFEALGAFLFVTLTIVILAPFVLGIEGATFFGYYFPLAFVIGALAAATAPAATMAVIRQYRAKGPLTTTLLSMVAFDDALAIIFFSIALSISQPLVVGVSGLSVYDALFVPLLEVVGAIGIGAVLAFALIYVAKLVRARALLLVVVLGTVMLCVGIAELLGISSILANMVIGFIVANRMKRDEMFLVIDDIEDVIFALFFVLAGLHFDLSTMKVAGILALLITLSRFVGKYFGVRAGAHISGAPETVRKYLGFALLPQAGVALGLALLAESAFPTFGAIIFNGVLAAVTINELAAPLLVRYAIFKAGEQHEA